MKRFATLGVLLIGTLVALLDNFPSISNLARLEFLTQPAYFVYRTISFDTLIVAFGLMFLLSNRFSLDKKSGVKMVRSLLRFPGIQYIYLFIRFAEDVAARNPLQIWRGLNCKRKLHKKPLPKGKNPVESSTGLHRVGANCVAKTVDKQVCNRWC